MKTVVLFLVRGLTTGFFMFVFLWIYLRVRDSIRQQRRRPPSQGAGDDYYYSYQYVTTDGKHTPRWIVRPYAEPVFGCDGINHWMVWDSDEDRMVPSELFHDRRTACIQADNFNRNGGPSC